MNGSNPERDRSAPNEGRDDLPNLLTIPEVAAMSRFSVVTVRRWIRTGALARIQPSGKGGAIRVHREALQTLLDELNQDNRPTKKSTSKHHGPRPKWMKDQDHGQATEESDGGQMRLLPMAAVQVATRDVAGRWPVGQRL